MKTCDVCILGAGISGLSFAQRCLQNGINAVVLESSHKTGGCIDTFLPVDGLAIERGPHTLYRIYTKLYALLSDSLINNIHANLPFKHFLTREKKRVPFMSPVHWTDMWRLIRAIWMRPSGKTIGTFFSPLFGNRNMHDCFQPAFDALYCQAARDFPAELLFKKRDRRSLKQLPRAYFLNNGMGSLLDDLSANLDIRLNCTVTKIDYQNNTNEFAQSNASGVYIIYGEKRDPDGNAAPFSMQCRRLVFALPPDATMRLLRPLLVQILDPHTLSGLQLPNIAQNQIASFSIAYKVNDEGGINKESGVVGLHQPFYSAIFARRSKNAPKNIDGATFHFKDAGISAENALNVACDALQCSPANVIQFEKKINRLPAMRPEHLPRIRQLDAILPESLALIGNYFGGFSLEDCVERSNKVFNRWISQKTII